MSAKTRVVPRGVGLVGVLPRSGNRRDNPKRSNRDRVVKRQLDQQRRRNSRRRNSRQDESARPPDEFSFFLSGDVCLYDRLLWGKVIITTYYFNLLVNRCGLHSVLLPIVYDCMVLMIPS